MKLGFDNIVVNDVYEKTDWPLLKTVPPPRFSYTLKARSNSSPDISVMSDSTRKFSSSLPMELRSVRSVALSDSKHCHTPIKRANKAKRNAPKVDNDFGHWDATHALLNFTFVDEQHPKFERTYNKQHCIVKANLADVEVGMNRRTWTMLLNFFGALGQRPSETNKKPNESKSVEPTVLEKDPILEGLLYGQKVSATELANAIKRQQENKKQPVDSYILRLLFEFAELTIHMNYPANNTRLGHTSFSDVDFDLKANLTDFDDPMRIALKIAEFSLLDSTPFYSRLYNERLSLKPHHSDLSKKPKLLIDVLKYRTDDLELKRKFDILVNVSSDKNMSIHYVHTHHQVRRLNEGTSYIAEAQKTRCKVTVDLETPLTLILPLNQFCDEVICLEASSIKVTNGFLLASQIPALAEHAIEVLKLEGDDYDCLMESMQVVCADVCIRTGLRHSTSHSKLKTTVELDDQRKKRRIGESAFENFWFELNEENVLNREFPLTIDVYRNLSAFISHNLPDMAIITHFEDLDLAFTTDFYCLLRGFLEKNLGDALIPVPETIPLELLQSPDRAFTVSTNQNSTFLLPSHTNEYQFDPFGVVVLHKARISFDAYIDNQSEFDLICESTELTDTRYDHLPKNQRPNIFPTILSPRKRKSKLSSGNTIMLMSEAHIMMRKDEPPTITLVLMNSRVLLILDWLNQAKDFVCMNTSFVPPEENTDQQIIVGAPKDGVLVRNLSTKLLPDYKPPHTITLKITLKESDLLLLEDSSKSNSLALVGHTTAVLNLNDASGVIESNFEIQNMHLSWCLMSAEQSTNCQISNEFNLTVVMSKDIQVAKAIGTQRGLSNLYTGPRQALKFEVGEVVCRMSYKDLLVTQAVIQGALKHPQTNLSRPQPFSSARNSPAASPRSDDLSSNGEQPAAINIKSVSVNAPSMCAWFLDDSQGVALPLVRLILTNLRMHYANEKIDTNMIVGLDYFNQRVFGWEPLIESWPIEKLLYQWSGQASTLKIQPSRNHPLNFNVTQTFIQQAKHFFSTWPDIQKSLKTDLRTMCVRLRSDHLLYLIRNETGLRLTFTTDNCLEHNKAIKSPTRKWFVAMPDRSCTFEFPTKLLIRDQPKAESRQLIIRVDGWNEVSPVSVDSVGTYIRITRKSDSTPTFARLVIEVSMEPNGRKVVVVRSAMTIINKLSDPLRLIFTDPQIGLPSRLELLVRPGMTISVPLSHVNSRVKACPFELEAVVSPVEIKWYKVKTPGEVQNKSVCFTNEEESTHDDVVELCYWVCTSVKHEMYPEHETPLCGHSICFMPALSVLNLLPNDADFRCNKSTFTIQASQRMQTSTVDLDKEIIFSVSTEQFRTVHPIVFRCKSLNERVDNAETNRILMELFDEDNRKMHVYASISVVRGGALNITLWVPFWIVNRSGIPLIIKQESSDKEAAGQVADHEEAKDRNPLMFSFSDDACPFQCTVRVGKKIAGEPGFKPQFSNPFSLVKSQKDFKNSPLPIIFTITHLVPGIQALKLISTHDQLATRVYNIGVEVRPGTGRYKDTQVVIFAPRYRLNNRSPFTFFVAHKDECAEPKKHIELAANCNMVWHENYEDKRILCIRRDSLMHWSTPFRIDQVGSYHATIREKDETPRFVCIEITLQNASFWITFTDASLFPPPISVLSKDQKLVHPIQLHPDDDSNTSAPPTSLDIHLDLAAGLGVSLVRDQAEELIYVLFKGVELNLMKKNNNYQLAGHVNAIQIDNQLFNADRWPVLYCDAYVLRSDDLPEGDEKGPVLPALKMEISWTPKKYYDAFDCFRLKLCNMSLLLDELLIWKLAHFVQETDTAHSINPVILIQPPSIEIDISLSSAAPTRRCYFGILELEIGDLCVSGVTVSKNILPRELKRLKHQFNIYIFNFENALVRLPPFRKTNCFETTTFLIDSLGSFYEAEVRKQLFNFVITLDAFGNPLGLASDLKESFQTLFFEGDFSGFFTGLGYGVSNSLSKVVSTTARFVGTAIFDEQHELLRRRMLRSQSENSTPFTQLFGGVKGLGVGVYGMLTSLPKNTFTGMQKEGLPGMIRGMGTGAVDSVTKPVQGVLDFVAGTTSAIKDATSGHLGARTHFCERRNRLPRICTNLQSLLPPYSCEQAEAQQELFRIVGRSSAERLLDLLVILVHVQDGKRICHRALICTDQCYITRQIGQEPSSVIQRIVYRNLRNIQPAIKTESGLVKIEVLYDDSIRKFAAPAHIWCSNHDTAARFSDLILRAKQRYEHTRRALTVMEEMEVY
ncbi:hypothetical protein M3Y97_00495100 [Aphelenchoides bicaudatus]|nr:hypothetical protein M3Y97_00495100 [Aphelenchoides bicaudatus]